MFSAKKGVSEISEEREISIDDVSTIDIPPSSFVMIRTARGEKEAYGTPAYFSDHPQLSIDLIEYLLDKKYDLSELTVLAFGGARSMNRQTGYASLRGFM